MEAPNLQIHGTCGCPNEACAQRLMDGFRLDFMEGYMDEMNIQRQARLFAEHRGTCKYCKGWGPDGYLCHTCADYSNFYRKRYNQPGVEAPPSELWWQMYGYGFSQHPVFDESPLNRCALCQDGHVQPWQNPDSLCHCWLPNCTAFLHCCSKAYTRDEEGSTRDEDLVDLDDFGEDHKSSDDEVHIDTAPYRLSPSSLHSN